MKNIISKINEVGFIDIWWTTLKAVVIVGAVGTVASTIVREGKDIIDEFNR